MGLWVSSRKEGPVVTLEVTWFSTPEEGTARLQQDQDHVNCVFDWEGVIHHEYTTLGQTAAAVSFWWSAASSQQPACSGITSHAEFFGETNHPHDSAPLQPRFGALWLLDFPKTKIAFEREEISDNRCDSGKENGTLDDKWKRGFCRVFWTVEEMLGDLCKVPRCLLWRRLRRRCPMQRFLVFCISFSKCLYFSYYMAGSFLDFWIITSLLCDMIN